MTDDPDDRLPHLREAMGEDGAREWLAYLDGLTAHARQVDFKAAPGRRGARTKDSTPKKLNRDQQLVFLYFTCGRSVKQAATKHMENEGLEANNRTRIEQQIDRAVKAAKHYMQQS